MVQAIVMVCLLMFLTGCSNTQQEQNNNQIVFEDSTIVEEPKFDIRLSDIEKPIFGKQYLTAECDDRSYDVCYGDGYPCYLTLDSGLPGFGYPMVIVGESFQKSTKVSLHTSYGDYVYSFSSEDDSFATDSVNYGLEQEDLYMFSELDGICYIYTYEGGPAIGE